MKSLSDLQLTYLDLYLIHWPGAQGMKPEDERHPELRKGSWQAMEALCREGLVRSIGLSNYTLGHLEELLTFCDIKPSVLQVSHQFSRNFYNFENAKL
jgi:diketogulonate reductase-like aldo/keto reductase